MVKRRNGETRGREKKEGEGGKKKRKASTGRKKLRSEEKKAVGIIGSLGMGARGSNGRRDRGFP